MKNISDMSILITGGGSGIGEGTASYFVKNGAKVTICGRNKDKLENVSKKPRKYIQTYNNHRQ